MGLLNTGIMSLSTGAMNVVEVNAENLAHLERLAGFGRFSLIALAVAVVCTLVHFYIKARVATEVRKIIKSELKYEVKRVAAKAIKDACNYGEIYDAINKEIDDACDFGAIYKLVKYGSADDLASIEIDAYEDYEKDTE